MMKEIADEKRGRLLYLKRELLRRVSRSSFFDSHCHYVTPMAKMPVQIKQMIREIDQLEKEIASDTT